MRTELGFERTTCACETCVKNCRHMPGFLIPSDLARMIPPDLVPTIWAESRLLASPGALVMKAGRVYRIRTLVPAIKPDGSCVHLDTNNRCTIHQIAPFGCAYFDCGPERGNLSHFGLREVEKAWENNDLYALIWRHLDRQGHTQLSAEILRARMRKYETA
jgi:hypothetical protein